MPVGRRDDFHERVLHAAQSTTVVVDRDGVIRFVSGAGEALLGWPASAVVGRNMADLIDPDDLDEALGAFSAVLSHDDRWPPALIRLRAPDGTVVPTEVAGHGTFDDPVIGGAVYAVHRMDETMCLHRILAALATGEPLGEALRLVTEMVAVPPLQLDVAVLHDGGGDRFDCLAGGPLDAELHDLLLDPPDGVPWAAAAVGSATRDEAPRLTLVDDLPTRAAAVLAGSHLECWVSPLEVERGRVAGALVALSRATTLPGATIRQRMRRARDVCELAFVRRDHEDRLRHAALHDGLTKIPNRVRFFDALEHGVGQRGGPLTGVLYLDLDGFKPLNDRYGHAFGDHVLVEVAARIDRSLRPHDLAARLGGDEFAVLLEDLADPDEALAVAHRVLDAVAAPLVLTDASGVGGDGATPPTVGVSIGVAVGSSDGDRDRLLHAADQAMYEAKRSGAGAVRLVVV